MNRIAEWFFRMKNHFTISGVVRHSPHISPGGCLSDALFLLNSNAFEFQNLLKLASALSGRVRSPGAAPRTARTNNQKAGTCVWRNSIGLQTCSQDGRRISSIWLARTARRRSRSSRSKRPKRWANPPRCALFRPIRCSLRRLTIGALANGGFHFYEGQSGTNAGAVDRARHRTDYDELLDTDA
jgi:hypothetical protein